MNSGGGTVQGALASKEGDPTSHGHREAGPTVTALPASSPAGSFGAVSIRSRERTMGFAYAASSASSCGTRSLSRQAGDDSPQRRAASDAEGQHQCLAELAGIFRTRVIPVRRTQVWNTSPIEFREAYSRASL